MIGSGQITTLDGCRIAWRSDGPTDAPALVLSNSLGSTMAMWDDQIEALARDYRVIRYDQRGHGGSGIPAGEYSLDRLGSDVIDLLDALGIGKAHFCGVSLGGMTGQWLGYRAPERFDRLILACTSPYMGPATAWQERIATVRTGGMAAIVEAVVARWVTSDFAAAHPDRLDDLHAMVRSTPDAGYAACCAAIRDMDLRATASLIRRPVLVIAGADDPATPPSQGEMLANSIPGARFTTIPGAHLANICSPDAFNAAIWQFLGELSLQQEQG